MLSNQKDNMRVLVEIRNAMEGRDARHQNRTLFERAQECLKKLDAEAVYFGFHNEQKTAYLILNVSSLDKLPHTVEPLCLNGGVDMDFARAENSID